MSVTLPTSLPTQKSAVENHRWFQNLIARIESSDVICSLLAVFDQGMISGTNFVTAILIGRCCGAETLGIYSLVAAAIAMTVGVQDQLITAPYVLYHNRKKHRSLKRYAGSVLLHQFVFSALISIGVAVCLFAGAASSSTAQMVTLILLIAAPGILLRAFIREVALAHYDVMTVVLVDAVVCVCQLAVVGGLFAVEALNLATVYCVLGAACVVTAAVWMKYNRGRFVFDREATSVSWTRNWRFGRWALATHLAGTSTPYIMPWVLFALRGDRETGLLASCSVIVGIANILLSGLGDFLTPRAASAYASGGIKQLRKILRSMLGLSVIAIGSVVAVSALFGEQIIDVLYNGRFAGTGTMVTVMSLAVLANAFGNVAGNGLWALDRPRANFVADMLTLVVAISTAPILIGPYGALGAAGSTLAASAFGAFFRQLIFMQAAAEKAQ